MENQSSPTVRAAAMHSACLIGKCLVAIVGFVGAAILLYWLSIKAGPLIGIAWTYWQLLLTDHWVNVWPATWVVWICTLLAVWCGCVTYQLRNSKNWFWFAAAAGMLIVVGILPANCAAWATIQQMDPHNLPPLTNVAIYSTILYAIAGCMSPVILVIMLLNKLAE